MYLAGYRQVGSNASSCCTRIQYLLAKPDTDHYQYRMSNDADDDWLAPHEAMTAEERFEALLVSDPGCYLRDSEADSAQPFADIVTATAEAPASPEATVRDAAGQCLAMSSPDRASWVFTRLGAMRVELDAGLRVAS